MPNKGKWLYWLMLIVLTGALLAYAQQRNLWYRYIEHKENGEQENMFLERLDSLKLKESKLNSKIKKLNSDPLEKEAVIRHNKGLVRQGEKIYRIKQRDAVS